VVVLENFGVGVERMGEVRRNRVKRGESLGIVVVREIGLGFFGGNFN
jgi:hypothetical protein